MLVTGTLQKLLHFLKQPSTFRNELCMLVAHVVTVCSSLYAYRTCQATSNNEHEKAVKIAHEEAVKMVEVIGKAAAQLRSFPVFFKHTINPPTTTCGRSVEDRLKAIKEAT